MARKAKTVRASRNKTAGRATAMGAKAPQKVPAICPRRRRITRKVGSVRGESDRVFRIR